MSKKNYDVNKSVRPSKDGSFGSMICAMLVFFAICAIMLLAAWPWKTANSKSVNQYDTSKSSASGQHGSENIDSTTTITTTTTDSNAIFTTERYKNQRMKIPTSTISNNKDVETIENVTFSYNKAPLKYINGNSSNNTSIKSKEKEPTIEILTRIVVQNFTSENSVVQNTFTENPFKLTTESETIGNTTEDKITTDGQIHIYQSTKITIIDNDINVESKAKYYENVTTEMDYEEVKSEITTESANIYHRLSENNDVVKTTTENYDDKEREIIFETVTTTETSETTTDINEDNSSKAKINQSLQNYTTTTTTTTTQDSVNQKIDQDSSSTEITETTTEVNEDNSSIVKVNQTLQNYPTTITTTTQESVNQKIHQDISSTETTETTTEVNEDNLVKVNQSLQNYTTTITTQESTKQKIDLAETTTETAEISSGLSNNIYSITTTEINENEDTSTEIDQSQSVTTTETANIDPRLSEKINSVKTTTEINEAETTTLLEMDQYVTTTQESTNEEIHPEVTTSETAGNNPTLSKIINAVQTTTEVSKDENTTITEVDEYETTTQESINKEIEEPITTTETAENNPTLSKIINAVQTTTEVSKGEITTEVVEFATTTPESINKEIEEPITTTETAEIDSRLSEKINYVRTTTDINKNEVTENGQSIPAITTTTIPDTTTINEHQAVKFIIEEKSTIAEIEETLTTTEKLTYNPIMETENTQEEREITKAPEKNTKIEYFNKNLCDSSSCRTSAARMLAQVNHEKEPCDNFYDFACGGLQINDDENEEIWENIAIELEEIDENSSLSIKLFRKYYDSCLDFHTSNFDYEERKANAKGILKSFWQPKQSNGFDEAGEDAKLLLTQLFVDLLQYDFAPLFDVSVDVDKQSKQFIFQLKLGTQYTVFHNENEILKSQRKCLRDIKKEISTKYQIDMNSLYDTYLHCKNNHSDYINSVKQTIKVFDLQSHMNIENITSHIQFIFDKYKNLPNVAHLRTELNTKNYVVKKIGELNLHLPFIKWDYLFTNLVKKELNNEDLVQVYFEDFFKSIFTRTQGLTKWQLYNTLIAMFANNLYTSYVSPGSIPDPEKYCLQRTSILLKEISWSIHLKKINNENLDENIKTLTKMFIEMQTNLRETLSAAEWLEDNRSKISVFKKLKEIDLVTNMDVWRNDTILQARIANVANDNFENYLQFSLALVKRYKQMNYNLWKQNAWDLENIWWYYQNPYSNQFVSIYALNKIVVSPSMLIKMSSDVPQYITLAKIGFALAKQIGHHFDLTGIKYGMNLYENSKQAYKTLESCSVTQYQQPMYTVFGDKNLTYQINETLKLSLNNRIAEETGIKLIYDVSLDFISDRILSWISDTYSREKILFIVYAQEHCRKTSIEDFLLELFESETLPASVLLKMTLSNLVAFKDTFQCKDGSGMDQPYPCPGFQDLEKYEAEYED